MVLGTAAVGGVLRHFHRNREATRRAIYFWSRAGPMVAHYRLAQWWLTTTTANRTRRDRVYDTLRERYCHPSLTIRLHLKGLYHTSKLDKYCRPVLILFRGSMSISLAPFRMPYLNGPSNTCTKLSKRSCNWNTDWTGTTSLRAWIRWHWDPRRLVRLIGSP